MKEIITELISEKEIKKRINELGDEISKAYYGKEIRLIGILKGGAMFACELAKRIQVPVIMDFMQAQSYGSGTYSSGTIYAKVTMHKARYGFAKPENPKSLNMGHGT